MTRTLLTLIPGAWRAALMLALGLVAGSALAQPRSTAHLMLGSDYGEFCTMCEAFVACGAALPPELASDASALNALDEFTLYYFPTRTFWQQVLTIWEWFRAIFVPVNAHGRPLGVYTANGGQWTYSEAETHFSIEPPQIRVPGATIERDTGVWRDAQDDPAGHCLRLPLWDTIKVVDARLAQGPGDKHD